MFTLITSQIKTYANIILAVITLAGIGFTHFKAYEYGEARIQEKMDKQRENLNDQIQQAINAKNAVIAEHDNKYQLAENGYNGAINVLNQRLSELKTLPRNTGLCMAGSVGNFGTVFASSKDTPRTVTTLASGEGICDVEFYSKAMTEHVQCQHLIDLFK